MCRLGSELGVVDGCAFGDVGSEGGVVVVDETCGDGELGLTSVAEVVVLGSIVFVHSEVGEGGADVAVEGAPEFGGVGSGFVFVG